MAAIPFGSTSLPATMTYVVALCLALSLGVVGSQQPARAAMAAPVGALIVLAMIASVQEASPPLLGAGAEVWRRLDFPEAGDGSARLAFSAGRTLPAFGGPLLAALAVCCGIVIGHDRRVLSKALRTISIAGSIYAVVALVAYAIAPGHVWWWPKLFHQGDLTASFTNRNSAALFIGLGLCAIAGHAASRLARHLKQRRATDGRSITRNRRRLAFSCVQLAISLTALLLTHSRAGILLSLASAGVVFLFRLRRRGRVFRPYLAAVVGVLVLVPLVAQLLPDARLGDLVNDGGRLNTYRATIDLIGDHPWLGIGLGSYGTAFPTWRLPGAAMWGVWDRAHNTLLELAAEVGLPFAVALASGWTVVLAVTARNALSRPERFSAVPFAMMLLGTLHSLIDFAVQIPGCAGLFYLAAGMCIGQMVQPAQTRSRRRRHVRDDELSQSASPSGAQAPMVSKALS